MLLSAEQEDANFTNTVTNRNNAAFEKSRTSEHL
jgi:hypothetical protein